MFGLGMWELLILLVIVLLIFGGRRLPVLGDSLGRSVKEWREATVDVTPREPKEEKTAVKSEPASLLEDFNEISSLRTTRGKLKWLGKLTGLNK